MDADSRCFRVALVAGELLNAPGGDVDAPLLEQVAEQVEEFARHGYTLAVIRGRPGLDEALARVGVAAPPAFDPETADDLRAFLAASCR